MRFFIEELEVLFPFPSIYREQYQYMVELKKALDAKGHCLLEMPTGTGKTVALLSLILSYQHKHTDTRKLVYCTRTVHEMTQVISELKVVEEYRRSVLGGQSQLFGMCLSSRRNLCINPDVIGVGDREQVDSLCRERIAEWARKSDADKKRIRGTPLASTHSDDDVIDIEDLAGGGGGGVGSGSGDGSSNSSGRMCCSFYENYERLGTDAIPCGIYSLDDLRELGRARGWCPYFAARHLLSVCNIVVYNYQYMLDPKIATLVSRELSEQSIVVFDEAHNIDNVCVEALSVEINQRTLNMATGNLTRLKNLVAEMRESDTEKLRSEYQRLLKAVIDGHPREELTQMIRRWKMESTEVRLSRIAEQAGIASIAIHGRTRDQKYAGVAEYDTIRAVKQAVSIPVFANGDVDSPQKARQVLWDTGADGLLIGRAAQGRPWIFREIDHFLRTGEMLPAPSPAQIGAWLIEHLEGLYTLYGERRGVRVARKHIGWYADGHPEQAAFLKTAMRLESAREQLAAVSAFFGARDDAVAVAA